MLGFDGVLRIAHGVDARRARGRRAERVEPSQPARRAERVEPSQPARRAERLEPSQPARRAERVEPSQPARRARRDPKGSRAMFCSWRQFRSKCPKNSIAGAVLNRTTESAEPKQ